MDVDYVFISIVDIYGEFWGVDAGVKPRCHSGSEASNSGTFWVRVGLKLFQRHDIYRLDAGIYLSAVGDDALRGFWIVSVSWDKCVLPNDFKSNYTMIYIRLRSLIFILNYENDNIQNKETVQRDIKTLLTIWEKFIVFISFLKTPKCNYLKKLNRHENHWLASERLSILKIHVIKKISFSLKIYNSISEILDTQNKVRYCSRMRQPCIHKAVTRSIIQLNETENIIALTV